jgi:hypothetical protein
MNGLGEISIGSRPVSASSISTSACSGSSAVGEGAALVAFAGGAAVAGGVGASLVKDSSWAAWSCVALSW